MERAIAILGPQLQWHDALQGNSNCDSAIGFGERLLSAVRMDWEWDPNLKLGTRKITQIGCGYAGCRKHLQSF